MSRIDEQVRRRASKVSQGLVLGAVLIITGPALAAEPTTAASPAPSPWAGVHPWTLVHKPQACLAQTVLTTKEDAGSTKISVQNAQDFVNGQPVVIGLKDGTRFSTAVATVTDRDATQELALTTALPGPAEAGASLQALEPDQPSSAVISLDLSMQDASVVCRLMRDYGNNRPDTPLKLLDSYAPTADKAWRQQIRDACVGKTDSAVDICARDAARAMRDGIDPPDTEGRSPDGYLAIDQSYRDREWNKPDRTLIEFEWTPCTPYLVGRGWDRWRAQHLNITTTGSLPSGMPVAPSKGLPNLDNKMVGVGKLGSAELSPTKLGTGDGETDAVLQNICLNSATVRTALRDRWANYIHIALRENMDAVTETDPDCPECGPRFKVGAYRQGDVPHSRVTDIAWKNTWLDRQQWLVMVRDHFLARLKTEGLDPNYQLPGPARLVYCGPEVRYGGVPTGKQYYWKNLQPGDKYNCDTWRPGPRDTRTAPGFYKELTISFEPDATLLLSRGPAFQDKWDRDQSRLVGRAVEYLARYHSVAPLVQNDGGPTPLATCRNPLPANGNAGKCNAEAPRRDAVTPRFGDIFEGPVAEAPVETPPK